MGALNIAGLLLSLAGVILLFRYGMPYRLQLLAAPGRTHHARPKPGDGQELAQRKRRALTGLVRIILGTMLQVIVTLRTMPLWS